MSTRAIVTSHPHVACFVCERTLLRGEHPEIFIVDGAPQTVCELCAPRAAHQGWPRGEEGQVLTQPVVSSKRQGGFFGRLRGSPRPGARMSTGAARERGEPRVPPRVPAGGEPPGGAAARGARVAVGATVEAHLDEDQGSGAPQPGPLEWALDAFNASEYPRRTASLSRSLGVPDVNVALDEDLHIVTIVVAWELCWYRYRVDLDEQPDVRMIAEGRTLEELERAERVSNAVADERGTLSLIAEAV